jgi:3-oxoacyl-[acyl-carrier-protein] synthase II
LYSTNRRIVITGVGAVTPVGNTSEDTWNALLEGKSGTGLLTAIDSTPYTSKVAAEVKDFEVKDYMHPKSARKTDRFVHFAMAASKMAVEDSKLDVGSIDLEHAGVLIGSGIGGLPTVEKQHNILRDKGPERMSPFTIPMLIANIASGHVGIEFGFKGPNTCVVTACASGTNAIGDAYHLIKRAEANVMIAGGTESCITDLGFGGFDAMRALSVLNDEPEKASRPFDATRAGFVMGEGAGILILEELEHAKKRGAHIYCEMLGYSLTSDANHITAPDPTGAGAARCMSNTIKFSGIKPEDVDYINAHGTSTPLNDKTETLAIKKALGDHANKVMISSTKSMTGHLLGAAGGVEAIVCAKAIQESKIPPTINQTTKDPECDLDYVPNEARSTPVKITLSNSLGFGGHNATICFKEFQE